MLLSHKIRREIEDHPQIKKIVTATYTNKGWSKYTRTHFDVVASVINKSITREVINNPDLIKHHLVIGKLKIEKDILNYQSKSAEGLVQQLSKRSEYNIYNWVSGKTLHSYWNNGSAKIVKVNALLVFLKVPFSEWDSWIKDKHATVNSTVATAIFPFKTQDAAHASLAIVRRYYTGNYYLYYQKTDGSNTVIKTPFVIREEDGELMVHSVSEGHRYIGRVMGVRDGCLYINCQNLDFEEMEQYVFNIGLETNPEVLFGVSTTVSVKERLGVALKNVLVKQKAAVPGFETEPELEIPFGQAYKERNEEAIIVDHLKTSAANIIKTSSCCNLSDM